MLICFYRNQVEKTSKLPPIPDLHNPTSGSVGIYTTFIYDIRNNYAKYNEYQFYLYANLVYTNEVKGNERHCRKM